MTLVDWLKAQKRPSETNEQFAARLGISAPLWSLLQSGQRQPTFWLLKQATVAFPEYRDELIAAHFDSLAA